MSIEILLLDDDRAALGLLEAVLTEAGFKCHTATDSLHALMMVRAHKEIAVIIIGIYTPDLTGVRFADLLNCVKLNWSAPAVLLMSVPPTLEAAVDAMRLGVCDFLSKPICSRDLVAAVRRTMARVCIGDRPADKETKPDLERLVRHAEEIAGALRHINRTRGPSASTEPRAVPAAPCGGALTRSGSPQEAPSVIEVIERLRTLRHRYDHKLDYLAWDLLLECRRAEQERRRLPVSALLISIPNVSSTTCFRRINELADRGYLRKVPDAHDGRREFVQLTAKASGLLADYLEHASTCLSALPHRAAPQQRAGAVLLHDVEAGKR